LQWIIHFRPALFAEGFFDNRPQPRDGFLRWRPEIRQLVLLAEELVFGLTENGDTGAVRI